MPLSLMIARQDRKQGRLDCSRHTMRENYRRVLYEKEAIERLGEKKHANMELRANDVEPNAWYADVFVLQGKVVVIYICTYLPKDEIRMIALPYCMMTVDGQSATAEVSQKNNNK